jgi:hypothetical protein
MTEYEPRNQSYIFHPNKLATVWIREESWTYSEIYAKLKITSNNVITHILRTNKYE